MPETKQPKWEFLANLGDVNPAEHGGFIVYIDTTGVYPPEVEVYDADDEATGGTLSRFIIEPRPEGEWWYDKLDEVADACGADVASYVEDLTSADVVKRAGVYRDLVQCFGPFQFDQYPLRLSEAEAEARYASILRRR